MDAAVPTTMLRPMLSGARSDSVVRSQVWHGRHYWWFQSLNKGASHTGSKGSTVVHGWIGASNVAKELETSGTDDEYEWWLVSALADLFIRNMGPTRNS